MVMWLTAISKRKISNNNRKRLRFWRIISLLNSKISFFWSMQKKKNIYFTCGSDASRNVWARATLFCITFQSLLIWRWTREFSNSYTAIKVSLGARDVKGRAELRFHSFTLFLFRMGHLFTLLFDDTVNRFLSYATGESSINRSSIFR